MDNDLIVICDQIFRNIISQLTIHLRFMDIALDHYIYVPRSTSIECDGTFIYYDPITIIKKFKLNPNSLTRGYMHMILHSIFKHQFLTYEMQKSLWDVACDIAVENMILELKLDCLKVEQEDEMLREINKIKSKVDLLTAQKVYHYLKEEITTDEVKLLKDLFYYDDHSRWYHIRDVVSSEQNLYGDESKDDPTNSGKNHYDGASHDAPNDENQPKDASSQDDLTEDEILKIKKTMNEWQEISERIQTDLETFSNDYADLAGSMMQSLERMNREKYNYTAFLNKFMTIGEKQMINDDEFDYVFYTYGLKLYKNMPLIESLEYKETKGLRDFVIAIDTSGSVSGEIVQKFLQKTYNIFQVKQNFFNKFNIHIIQCDTQIQEDKKVTTLAEFDDYIQNMEIKGFGGTDFRTVFNYCNELIKAKEFGHLEGLIYFTDGDGLYPKQQPEYKSAFIFLDSENANRAKVPVWAIKYILDDDEIINEGE